MIITLNFPTLAETIDISSLVKENLEINKSLFSQDFYPTRDSVKIPVVYDATLASKLFTETQKIKLTIIQDLDYIFSGYVRPTSQLIAENTRGEIVLEALDLSEDLNTFYPTEFYKENVKICDNTDPINSAVHIILDGTGITLSSTAPQDTTIFPFFSIPKDSNRLKLLKDLLYYNGYTLYFLGDGKLSFIKWIQDSVAETYTFNDSSQFNIIDGMVLEKDDESEFDSLEIRYREIQILNNVQLKYFSGGPKDAYGNENLNWEGYIENPYNFKFHKIANLRVSGVSYQVDNYFFFLSTRDSQSFTFSQVGNIGAGLRLLELSQDYKSVKVRLEKSESSYYKMKLEWCKVIANVVGENPTQVYKLEGSKKNYKTINSDFIFSNNKAEDFANAYNENVIKNPYTCSFKSYVERPIAEIVKVDTGKGNFSFKGIIIEKSYNEFSKEYSYKVKPLIGITPSVNNLNPNNPFTPFPIIPTNEIIVNIPQISGSINPATGSESFSFKTGEPATFNDGIKVNIAGRNAINISASYKTTLGADYSELIWNQSNYSENTQGITYAKNNERVIFSVVGTSAVDAIISRSFITNTSSNFSSGLLGIYSVSSIVSAGNDFLAIIYTSSDSKTKLWKVSFSGDTPTFTALYDLTSIKPLSLSNSYYPNLFYNNKIYIYGGNDFHFYESLDGSSFTLNASYDLGSNSSFDTLNSYFYNNDDQLYFFGAVYFNSTSSYKYGAFTYDETEFVLVAELESGHFINKRFLPSKYKNDFLLLGTHFPSGPSSTFYTRLFDFSANTFSGEVSYNQNDFFGLTAFNDILIGWKRKDNQYYDLGYFESPSYDANFSILLSNSMFFSTKPNNSVFNLNTLTNFVAYNQYLTTMQLYTIEGYINSTFDDYKIRGHKLLDYNFNFNNINLINATSSELTINKATYISTEYSNITGTLNFNMSGDDLRLYLLSGNTTYNFINLRKATVRLVVKHNTASNFNLTFNNVYSIGSTNISNKVFSLASGNTKYSVFEIFSDGTNVFIIQGKFYA